MKLLHIHAKSIVSVKLTPSALKQLPEKKFGVLTTIQHLHKINDVLAQLKTAVLGGQLIGCNASSAERIADKVDAFLFVGTGVFHPIQVALKTGKEVWLWNPVSKQLGKLVDSVIEDFQRKKQGSLNKFLHAKKVGIIVSTKIGQKNLMRAFDLADMKGKDYFVFACDELDVNRLEDFNFIDMWVSTACPRIADEKINIINIDDLVEAGFLKLKKRSYEVPIWKSRMGLQD